GCDSKNVVSSWDVLDGKVDVKGHCVVIGGGLVGSETAEYVAHKGCEVSIVEMADKIANGESSTILPTMMSDFAQHHVKQYVNTKVDRIANDGHLVVATDTKENKEVTIDCDMVIMAVGSVKNSFDAEGVTTPIYYVGDCSKDRTADIASAIRSGYLAANEI
ncbi:MAG: FAD-dependent oxidoreductase, partial [Traorella sp.]